MASRRLCSPLGIGSARTSAVTPTSAHRPTRGPAQRIPRLLLVEERSSLVEEWFIAFSTHNPQLDVGNLDNRRQQSRMPFIPSGCRNASSSYPFAPFLQLL